MFWSFPAKMYKISFASLTIDTMIFQDSGPLQNWTPPTLLQLYIIIQYKMQWIKIGFSISFWSKANNLPIGQ